MHLIILCFISYYTKYSLLKRFVSSHTAKYIISVTQIKFAVKYILSVTMIETSVSFVFAFMANLRVSLHTGRKHSDCREQQLSLCQRLWGPGRGRDWPVNMGHIRGWGRMLVSWDISTSSAKTVPLATGILMCLHSWFEGPWDPQCQVQRGLVGVRPDGGPPSPGPPCVS